MNNKSGFVGGLMFDPFLTVDYRAYCIFLGFRFALRYV